MPRARELRDEEPSSRTVVLIVDAEFLSRSSRDLRVHFADACRLIRAYAAKRGIVVAAYAYTRPRSPENIEALMSCGFSVKKVSRAEMKPYASADLFLLLKSGARITNVVICSDNADFLSLIVQVAKIDANDQITAIGPGYLKNKLSITPDELVEVDAAIRSPSEAIQVFLCHASADKRTVRALYRKLRADGFTPWFDEENLLPGQDWEREITMAVRASSVVLVCLSHTSVPKEGFVQKEIKYALDVADEKPEGTIFIIPVRLDDCDVPARLRRWHWVNLFEKPGYSRLLAVLRKRQIKPRTRS